MPSISQRGLKIPASPIRKLVPFAEKAKKEGKKIFHLNIGQPDIETPASAIAAVQNADLKVLAYSHSAGFESYRKKLVGYYSKFDISLDHSDIIVTTGGSEAILFGMMSCLDPGDEILVPEPFYANYNGFSIAGGIKIKPITARIEDNFSLPPIEDFENLISPKTKGILICNPSNPTGYLYSKAELLKLKDIILRHDLYLFVDEVYREFCYDGKSYTSVLSIEGIENHVVVVDSISKRYSACGARIGALVSRNKEIIATAMKFAQARLSPPTLAQILAEATIDVEDEYLDKVLEEYDSRRRLVVERLRAMEGVVCPNPGGAFYTFVKLPIDNCDKFCRWLLESFEYQGATVMMAPGTGFYSTEGLGTDEARIAYVLNKDDLNQAMDCLESALKTYPGRTTSKAIAESAG
ncbi:MAG: pyridoxal phosphate-dependent aminotransferase [Bacteroidota bacterium]